MAVRGANFRLPFSHASVQQQSEIVQIVRARAMYRICCSNPCLSRHWADKAAASVCEWSMENAIHLAPGLNHVSLEVSGAGSVLRPGTTSRRQRTLGAANFYGICNPKGSGR